MNNQKEFKPYIPAEKVYVCVTGCENINRLYSLKIEKE